MRLIRLNHVLTLTGLSRGSIYRLERGGQFPRRRKLGANSVAWVDQVVMDWMQTRPAVRASHSQTEAA